MHPSFMLLILIQIQLISLVIISTLTVQLLTANDAHGSISVQLVKMGILLTMVSAHQAVLQVVQLLQEVHQLQSYI